MHPANNVSCGLQRFCKEVLVAKQVENDNVLAIEGVKMTDESKLLCIVSKWMELGNMHTFLKGNEVADRVELVSPGPYPRYFLSDSFGIAVWRDKGSRLLTLHRRGTRRSKKCKAFNLPFPLLPG